MAPMTEIAAQNPYAWFPVERSSEELITPTAANRLVGYPYTKYMVSVMDVDMAAALLVASHEKADALGVPADRRVYLRGWADRLRKDPGSLGMVSGVGMHMTKHVYAVYSSEPPAQQLQPVDGAALQAGLDALPQKAIIDSYTGRATIATYTVAHGRGGDAEW